MTRPHEELSALVVFHVHFPAHGVVAETSSIYMDSFQGASPAIKAFAHLAANPALAHVAGRGARLTHL